MSGATEQQPTPTPVTPEAGGEDQEAAKTAEFRYLSPEEIERAITEAKARPVPPERAKRINADLAKIEEIRQQIIGLEKLTPEQREEALRTMAGTADVRPVLDVLLGKQSGNAEDGNIDRGPSPLPPHPTSPPAGEEPKGTVPEVLIDKLKARFAGKEVDPEVWAEVEAFVSENPRFFSLIEAKIAELAKKPEYSRIEEKKEAIEVGLLVSLVNGHLTKADLSSILEGGIHILPSEEIAKIRKSDLGYKGVMFYSASNQALIISEKALVDEYHPYDPTTGKETIIEIDFEHSINHEIAHGVVEQGLLTSDEKRASRGLSEGKEGVVVPPGLLHLATEIIKVAGEVKEYLSFHSRNALNGLEGLGELSPQEKQKKQVGVALEIIADYTAIFMQTDGKEENFIAKCIDKVSTGSLVSHLAVKLGINETDPEKVRQGVREKLASINSADEEEKKRVLAEHPELAKVSLIFKKFYDLLCQRNDDLGEAEEKVGKRQGKLKTRGNIGGDGEDSLQFDEPMQPDDVSSFPQQNNEQRGKQEGPGVKDELTTFFQFIQAFAGEVGGGVEQAVSQ